MGELPILLVPLFAVSDRLWGAANPSFKGKKAVILMLAVGGGFLAGGPAGALFGLTWFVYRAIPFDGSSGAPETSVERVAALLRHLPVILPAALIAYWMGLAEPRTALLFLAYALGAAGLAIWYGAQVIAAKKAGDPIGNQNTFVEAARGALYGAATFAALAQGA